MITFNWDENTLGNRSRKKRLGGYCVNQTAVKPKDVNTRANIAFNRFCCTIDKRIKSLRIY